MAGFKWRRIFWGMNASPLAPGQIATGLVLAVVARMAFVSRGLRRRSSWRSAPSGTSGRSPCCRCIGAARRARVRAAAARVLRDPARGPGQFAAVQRFVVHPDVPVLRHVLPARDAARLAALDRLALAAVARQPSSAAPCLRLTGPGPPGRVHLAVLLRWPRAAGSWPVARSSGGCADERHDGHRPDRRTRRPPAPAGCARCTPATPGPCSDAACSRPAQHLGRRAVRVLRAGVLPARHGRRARRPTSATSRRHRARTSPTRRTSPPRCWRSRR